MARRGAKKGGWSWNRGWRLRPYRHSRRWPSARGKMAGRLGTVRPTSGKIGTTRHLSCLLFAARCACAQHGADVSRAEITDSCNYRASPSLRRIGRLRVTQQLLSSLDKAKHLKENNCGTTSEGDPTPKLPILSGSC
ncbi:hypothetical protein J6590_004971 [Homalodisca vitripennis]|nr:hypothetical protein J6590_004971 [Homalodisca vitripennis]